MEGMYIVATQAFMSSGYPTACMEEEIAAAGLDSASSVHKFCHCIQDNMRFAGPQ